MVSYVLGKLRPKMAVFTTPNADFNVIFGDRDILRHPDHKFEMSRMEFEDMVLEMGNHYDYDFEISGIGKPLNWNGYSENEIGCCSQCVVFRRRYSDVLTGLQATFCETEYFKIQTNQLYPATVRCGNGEEKLQELASLVRTYCHEYLTRKAGYGIHDDEENQENVPIDLVESCCPKVVVQFPTRNDLLNFLRSEFCEQFGIKMLPGNEFLTLVEDSPPVSEESYYDGSNNGENPCPTYQFDKNGRICLSSNQDLVDSEFWGDDYDQFSDAD